MNVAELRAALTHYPADATVLVQTSTDSLVCFDVTATQENEAVAREQVLPGVWEYLLVEDDDPRPLPDAIPVVCLQCKGVK